MATPTCQAENETLLAHSGPNVLKLKKNIGKDLMRVGLKGLYLQLGRRRCAGEKQTEKNCLLYKW